jgi:signal peptidase II
MAKFYKSFWLYGGLIPAVIIAADQATKYWATKAFDLPFNICQQNPKIGFEGYFKDMTPVVDLAMTCNEGVSFGMLSGDSDIKRWLLTIFALVMVGVLFYVLTTTKDKLSRLGIALIIGGAIGNGIDRMFFGAVTDFISVHDLIPFFGWIFNIADSAITCGVIGLILASFIHKPEPKES